MTEGPPWGRLKSFVFAGMRRNEVFRNMCCLSMMMAGLISSSAFGTVGVTITDSDGILDSTSTVAAPGQSFTVSINLAISGGETVGGITILPKADKSNVLKVTARSIVSAVLTDPTADVVANPNLNPQSVVDAGVTTANVNAGVNASGAVMQLTLKVDPATPANAYPIVLSFGKARWATIGANSVSAAMDTSAATYTVFPPCSSPPVIQSVVSRKTHGAAGDFDIVLPTAGSAGIECRSGGPSMLVITYDKPIGGSINVIASGAVAGVVSIVGSQLSIPLSNSADGACVSVTVSGVACQGSPPQVAPAQTVKVLALLGDVSGDAAVDIVDIGGVKTQSLKPITAANFTKDLNVDGSIDIVDIGVVKQRSLKITPGPCSN